MYSLETDSTTHDSRTSARRLDQDLIKSHLLHYITYLLYHFNCYENRDFNVS